MASAVGPGLEDLETADTVALDSLIFAWKGAFALGLTTGSANFVGGFRLVDMMRICVERDGGERG